MNIGGGGGLGCIRSSYIFIHKCVQHVLHENNLEYKQMALHRSNFFKQFTHILTKRLCSIFRYFWYQIMLILSLFLYHINELFIYESIFNCLYIKKIINSNIWYQKSVFWYQKIPNKRHIMWSDLAYCSVLCCMWKTSSIASRFSQLKHILNIKQSLYFLHAW